MFYIRVDLKRVRFGEYREYCHSDPVEDSRMIDIHSTKGYSDGSEKLYAFGLKGVGNRNTIYDKYL